LCQLASPLLPFVAEEIYRGLTGEESVHLGDWPETATIPEDASLVTEMDRVRDVCSTGLSLRRTRNVRVRQPLRSLTIAGPGIERLRPYLDLVRDEVNVKEVALSEDIEHFATFKLQVNARAVGPRLGSETKKVIAASKAGDWSSTPGGGVEVAGQTLEEGEFALLIEPSEGVECQALSTNDMIVVLDFELDDALRSEGMARDIVRVVQQARREAGLHVSDRIRLDLALPDAWREAVEGHRAFVAEQTLAKELSLVESLDGALTRHESRVGDETLHVGLARLAS